MMDFSSPFASKKAPFRVCSSAVAPRLIQTALSAPDAINSRTKRSLHVSLCSSKVPIEMLAANSTWKVHYLHSSFVSLCCLHIM